MVCAVWGGAFPSIKYLLNFFTPLQLVKYRYILALPFFMILVLTREKGRIGEALGKHTLAVVAASLFGVTGYNLSLAIGELEIPSGIASLIVNLSPVITLILAVFFLKEPLTYAKVGGMILSLTGLFLLVHLGAADSASALRYYLYALITFMAPLSWAIYTVTGKSLTNRFDSFTVTGLTMTLGTIPFLFTLKTGDLEVIRAIPFKAWFFLFYLSYICTVAGYTIWVLALQSLPSSKVASFVYLIPVFSVIIGRVFLDEPITVQIVVGAALLLSGVYVVNKSKAKKSPWR